MSDLTKYIDLLKIQIKKRKGQRSGTFSTFGKEYPHARNIIIRDYLDDKIVFLLILFLKKLKIFKLIPQAVFAGMIIAIKSSCSFMGKPQSLNLR